VGPYLDSDLRASGSGRVDIACDEADDVCVIEAIQAGSLARVSAKRVLRAADEKRRIVEATWYPEHRCRDFLV
jgi:hypothetical protein